MHQTTAAVTEPGQIESTLSNQFGQPLKQMDHRDAEPDVGVTADVSQKPFDGDTLVMGDVHYRIGGPLDSDCCLIVVEIVDRFHRKRFLLAGLMALSQTPLALAEEMLVADVDALAKCIQFGI